MDSSRRKHVPYWARMVAILLLLHACWVASTFGAEFLAEVKRGSRISDPTQWVWPKDSWLYLCLWIGLVSCPVSLAASVGTAVRWRTAASWVCITTFFSLVRIGLLWAAFLHSHPTERSFHWYWWMLSCFDGPVLIALVFLMPNLIRMTCCLRSICLHCGYDLTGNVSGVCPECGKAVLRAESVG